MDRWIDGWIDKYKVNEQIGNRLIEEQMKQIDIHINILIDWLAYIIYRKGHIYKKRAKIDRQNMISHRGDILDRNKNCFDSKGIP